MVVALVAVAVLNRPAALVVLAAAAVEMNLLDQAVQLAQVMVVIQVVVVQVQVVIRPVVEVVQVLLVEVLS